MILLSIISGLLRKAWLACLSQIGDNTERIRKVMWQEKDLWHITTCYDDYQWLMFMMQMYITSCMRIVLKAIYNSMPYIYNHDLLDQPAVV